MQTISNYEFGMKQYPIDINFGDNEISADVKVVDFMEKIENGEAVLTLCSTFFMKGPVRLAMKNGSLKIIVSEFIHSHQNVWLPVNDWEQYTHYSYTRIHTMKIMLPKDNFCVLRQLIIPEKSYLKVILTKFIVA